MNNNKVITIPTHNSLQYKEKLLFLKNLINKLYEEEQYLLPIFLLRCQLIEFSLKYLLINYPYKPDYFDEKKIEKLTIGQVIKKINKFNDPYMKNIIKNGTDLVNLRNDLTHNFIKSNTSINEINKNLNNNMSVADLIEKNIYYYLEFVEKELYGM